MPNQINTNENFENQSSPVNIKEISHLSMLDESQIKCKSVSARSILIEYGPIRVRHRRSSSHTMANGRRSKNDRAIQEDPVKSELRREKNRLAARELKRTRDNIEFDLMRQVEQLEEEQLQLEEQRIILEDQKLKLTRAIYNAKQAPLIPFIIDIDIPVMLAANKEQDFLFDIRSLINEIDESVMIFDE